MALAKITLFGMYEYGKTTEDYDLFEGLLFPSLIPSEVSLAIKNNILLRGGEFEVLYSDPVFYKNSIALWSLKWGPTVERWYKALNIEYNPLENYDRIEEWTDATANDKVNKKESDRKNDTFAADTNNQNSNSNNENKVSAFDASTYQPAEQDTNNTNVYGNSNSITTSRGNDTEAESEKSNQISGHSGRMHGNIGVTTSQQMLQSELDIAKFNFVDEVTNLFLTELTIYTY